MAAKQTRLSSNPLRVPAPISMQFWKMLWHNLLLNAFSDAPFQEYEVVIF
jgi:hypothetical protein